MFVTWVHINRTNLFCFQCVVEFDLFSVMDLAFNVGSKSKLDPSDVGCGKIFP